MNWYKRAQGSFLSKSNKWEEVESNKDTIQEMLDEGYTKKEIADIFGVNYQLFIKMLNKFKIYRSYEWVKQQAKELLDQGWSVSAVAKKLKIDGNLIKKMLNVSTRPMNYKKRTSFSPEEKKEIIRLHVEENLRPTEISKRTNRTNSSIVGLLKQEGVYKTLGRKPRTIFDPTPEDMKQIDYLYALPPEGKGMSLEFIGKKFGLPRGFLANWFRRTGRPTRSRVEQLGTPFSREELSIRKLIEWEEKGGFENYLLSIPKEKATNILNNFIYRLYKKNPGAASAIKKKYRKLIMENPNIDNELV